MVPVDHKSKQGLADEWPFPMAKELSAITGYVLFSESVLEHGVTVTQLKNRELSGQAADLLAPIIADAVMLPASMGTQGLLALHAGLTELMPRLNALAEKWRDQIEIKQGSGTPGGVSEAGSTGAAGLN